MQNDRTAAFAETRCFGVRLAGDEDEPRRPARGRRLNLTRQLHSRYIGEVHRTDNHLRIGLPNQSERLLAQPRRFDVAEPSFRQVAADDRGLRA